MKKHSAIHVFVAALWVVMAMWSFATPCGATTMHEAKQQAAAENLPPCHQDVVSNTPCDDAPIADCYDSNKTLFQADVSHVAIYAWIVPNTEPVPVSTAAQKPIVIKPFAQAPPIPLAFDTLIRTSPRIRV